MRNSVGKITKIVGNGEIFQQKKREHPNNNG